MAIFLRGTPQSPLASESQLQLAESADAKLITRLKKAAVVIALFTSALGAAVLIAWALRVPVLISIRRDLPQMNPLSAGLLIVAGVSLWLALTGQEKLARTCGAVLVLIGAARVLAFFAPGWDFGVDRFWSRAA